MRASPPEPKADNPYLRPLWAIDPSRHLERQITDTEAAIARCQDSLAEAHHFKDPARGRQLDKEYQAMVKKLEQLEAEYFTRRKVESSERMVSESMGGPCPTEETNWHDSVRPRQFLATKQ